MTRPLTPRDVLAEVLRVGQVIRDPEGPRVVVPPRLKPLVLTHRQALRALVLEGDVPVDEAPPPPPCVTQKPVQLPVAGRTPWARPSPDRPVFALCGVSVVVVGPLWSTRSLPRLHQAAGIGVTALKR